MRLFIKKRSPCCVEMCVARDLVIRGDTLTFDRDEVEFMSRQAQIFTEEGTKIEVEDLHFNLRPFRFDGKNIKISKVYD